MQFFKKTIHIDDWILLTGEERLQLIFFFAVSVPNDEWSRRLKFREALDNMIRKSSGAKLGRKKWCGDQDYDISL